MNIETLSNGNGRISKKEFQALDNLSDHPENLNFLDKRQLKELKSNLYSQMKKYSSRTDISPTSQDYVKRMTEKIIKDINKQLETNGKELEQEFPSIQNLKGLKLLIKQKIIKYTDVEKLFKEGRKKVKINYENGETEIVNLIDLKKLFKEIKQAQNYSIKSAQEGKTKSIDGKHINYDAISSYANKTNNFEKINGKIKTLLVKAQIYMGAKEKGNNKISIKLQNEMKQFGLDIKNNPSDKWCAAFIGDCLIKAGYFKNIKDLKKKLPEPYPDVASNYLGIGYFKGHIGIYTGGETMINGNSHNMVRYSKVNRKKLVGWIMPYDIGNINKIHFYHKENSEPPIGAILVFKRGNQKLPYNIRKISGI